MLQVIDAIVYVRALGSGRTRPGLYVCKRDDDSRVDVVVKRASGCDAGMTSLAREGIAACLAGDLGLPLSEPVWVNLPGDLIDAASADEIAFGSVYAGPQFSIWSPGSRYAGQQHQMAAAILMFDAIIQNADRRPQNPNCLIRGEEFRIIDHEAAFIYGRDAGILGWSEPWRTGGMEYLAGRSAHIFPPSLQVDKVDFDKIAEPWAAISDARLDDYRAAIHPSVGTPDTMTQVDRALSLIRDCREHIDECTTELRRILT